MAEKGTLRAPAGEIRLNSFLEKVNGRLAGRLAIPIHDAEGTLIGYAGRALNGQQDDPKYLFPSSEAHGFYKSHLLFIICTGC